MEDEELWVQRRAVDRAALGLAKAAAEGRLPSASPGVRGVDRDGGVAGPSPCYVCALAQLRDIPGSDGDALPPRPLPCVHTAAAQARVRAAWTAAGIDHALPRGPLERGPDDPVPPPLPLEDPTFENPDGGRAVAVAEARLLVAACRRILDESEAHAAVLQDHADLVAGGPLPETDWATVQSHVRAMALDDSPPVV